MLEVPVLPDRVWVSWQVQAGFLGVKRFEPPFCLIRGASAINAEAISFLLDQQSGVPLRGRFYFLGPLAVSHGKDDISVNIALTEIPPVVESKNHITYCSSWHEGQDGSGQRSSWQLQVKVYY